MKFLSIAAFVATLVALGLNTTASGQWTVTNLHPSGPNASHSSRAQAAGGQQVGYVKPSVGRNRAAIWSGTAGSYVDLHPNGALDSVAWGGGDGQQVGSVLSGVLGEGNHATLWTGSASSRVDLHPTGWASSVAFAARGGQQVGRGTFNSLTFDSAIVWNGNAASFVVLDPLNAGGHSRAEGTDGVQQVGFWTSQGGGVRAALWSGSAASHVDLHPTSGFASSRAVAVSNGQQVGYARTAGLGARDVASLWSGSAASFVNLHPEGALFSRAQGVLEETQVGYARFGSFDRAGLWNGSAASWVDLQALLPSEFESSNATGIARDGENLIVSGFGFNTVTNRTEALIWTARAVPEPGTGTLLAFGGLLGMLLRRRSRSLGTKLLD
ncbi:MAG: PEP-CTERM sorting domain-containing protein [Planctomycetaceae bacterium]|nr:PEP-CTERM sorting domain-containing protein [Planctomycetaceae bacterium]